MAKNKAKPNKGNRNLGLRVKRGSRNIAKRLVETNIRRDRFVSSPYGSNYTDKVPWNTNTVQTNATFEGRADGSMMRYFAAPPGIQVDATSYAADNQIPLMDMVRTFAEELDNQDAGDPDKSIKRRFHIQLTRRDMRAGVQHPDGTAPAQADYLDRCCQGRPLATYALNMGVGLLLTNTSSDEFNGRDIVSSAVQRSMFRTESVKAADLARYNQDSRRVEEVMRSAGFRNIDFNGRDGEQKYHDITSWMCLDDQLLEEDGNIAVPVYGTSALTPRYEELAIYVVTAKDKIRQHGEFYRPSAYSMKYAREFYRPDNSVVHVSMHGEIMSMKHTQIETEMTEDAAYSSGSEELSGDDVRRSQYKKVTEKLDNTGLAAEASRYHPFIDNQYTVMCVRAVPGEVPQIVKRLRKDYDMQVTPANGAIIDALHATLPGCNKPIFTTGKKRWWNSRAKRANQRVFDGMVFLNGIFNTFSPPVKDGVFGGLTNSFQEFRPWFLNPSQLTGKTPGENSPGVIVTGRPDAGKALPLDTPVLYADGSLHPMRDVKPGDRLRDLDGNVTSVMWKSPVMEDHRLVRLSLSDSRSVVADEDHLWPVRSAALVDSAKLAASKLRAIKPSSFVGSVQDAFDKLVEIGQESGVWVDRAHMADSLAVVMRPQDRDAYGLTPQDGVDGILDWLTVQGPAEILYVALRRLDQMVALSGSVADGHLVKVSSAEIRHLLDRYASVELYSLVKATDSTAPSGLSLKDFYDGEVSLSRILGSASVVEIGQMSRQVAADLPDIRSGRKRIEASWSDCLSLVRAAGRCVDQASGDLMNTVSVVQADPAGHGDVACISVDSPSMTFVLGDMTVTSNTTWMKQCAAQLANVEDFCAFFNFKTIDPIQPWWSEQMEERGGVFIPIDEERLAGNAGCLDPFNFYNRQNSSKNISEVISDAMLALWDQTSMGNQTRSATRQSSVTSWITDRVRNPLAMCTGDVIFGTARPDAVDADGRLVRRDREIAREFLDAEERILFDGGDTIAVAEEFASLAEEYHVVPPLPDRELRNMVENAVSSSSYPFWTAFVSMDGLADRYIADAIGAGKPILFEWGENFTPPTRQRVNSGSRLTPMEFDAVLSARVSLKYVRQALTRYKRQTGHGGMILIDEAAGPLAIPEFKADIEQLLRELRALGVRIVIGTQFLTDIPPEIGGLSSVHIICAISKNASDEEFQEFYRISEAREEDYAFRRNFIVHAGRTDESDSDDQGTSQAVRHAIPYAWLVDSVNNVNSPMLMGEFPAHELTGAMDDQKASQLISEIEAESYRDEETIRAMFSAAAGG